jgi:plastocyanin
VNAVGWTLLGVFLALLVAGVGCTIWVATACQEDNRRRARILSLSGAVAMAGLVGAVVVAAWSPGSAGMGEMMGGGMAGMRASSSGPCRSEAESASAVLIQGSRFCPSPLRVAAGTTVTWTNEDNVAHTVTSRTGPHFDSGSLGQGRSWSHRFDQAGTFSYYCAIHPWMTASIHVVD